MWSGDPDWSSYDPQRVHASKPAWPGSPEKNGAYYATRCAYECDEGVGLSSSACTRRPLPERDGAGSAACARHWMLGSEDRTRCSTPDVVHAELAPGGALHAVRSYGVPGLPRAEFCTVLCWSCYVAALAAARETAGMAFVANKFMWDRRLALRSAPLDARAAGMRAGVRAAFMAEHWPPQGWWVAGNIDAATAPPAAAPPEKPEHPVYATPYPPPPQHPATTRPPPAFRFPSMPPPPPGGDSHRYERERSSKKPRRTPPPSPPSSPSPPPRRPPPAPARPPRDREWWQVLGVARGAPRAAVRSAYLAAARRTHPDRVGGSAPAFQRVTAAYNAYLETSV